MSIFQVPVFFIVVLLFGCSTATAQDSEPTHSLAGAPPNTWQMLMQEKTGWRYAPAFVYEPHLKQFILTGGSHHARHKRHWDTELFNLTKRTWRNAYPSGAPQVYTPASGPTLAPDTRSSDAPDFFADKVGIVRTPWTHSGYGSMTQAYNQYAYDTDAKKLYWAYKHGLYIYDPTARTWSDTQAGSISKSKLGWSYGSLCYDPVNRELVAIAGNSDQSGGTPGTHVYSVAENKWEKLTLGSAAINSLRDRVNAARRESWALVSACRNRFYLAETDEESNVDIASRAAALKSSLKRLFAKVASIKIESHERSQVERAAGRVKAAAEKLGAVAGKLDGEITADLIASCTRAFDDLEWAERALDVEPTGRALSPAVYDPVIPLMICRR